MDSELHANFGKLDVVIPRCGHVFAKEKRETSQHMRMKSESADGTNISPSCKLYEYAYVLKELTYATALPNTPDKKEIAVRIAEGFQAIARAPTSHEWIHDAFNANRTMGSALRARMDKTTVRLPNLLRYL